MYNIISNPSRCLNCFVVPMAGDMIVIPILSQSRYRIMVARGEQSKANLPCWSSHRSQGAAVTGPASQDGAIIGPPSSPRQICKVKKLQLLKPT